MTKGGVLHHFPSKEALMQGLLQQATDTFDRRLALELEAEAEGAPGRWLRAYIRTVMATHYEDEYLIPALAAAVAADDQLLEPIRRDFRAGQAAAESDGIDPTLATIIRLAVDGIAYGSALKLDHLDRATSEKVRAALIRMTETTN